MNRRTRLTNLSLEYRRIWDNSFKLALATRSIAGDTNRAKRFANATIHGIVEADRELNRI